jgi:hypothetical protein
LRVAAERGERVVDVPVIRGTRIWCVAHTPVTLSRRDRAAALAKFRFRGQPILQGMPIGSPMFQK